MSKEKRTITNESGKSITILIAKADTVCYGNTVEWAITPAQWRRLVSESDDTSWSTEHGETISFTCYPYAAGCKYPGRK